MAKYPIPFGRHLLLLERINVGGMAEVFRAKAFGVEGFERIVAVKRILPTLAEDAEFIAMFIDEARIAAHLTHQNIVQIYELGKHDGTYFISMEYVAGKDLRQILDRQKRSGTPMDAVAAAFIVARVCEALDYAHRKRDPSGQDLGIIHRDVTPQNVIISYQGEVKLCDFGIAKAASRMSRTQVGVLKGKFAYMAPEQVEGRPVDRRGDIFALGVIFYEMLTGERLFLGDSDYATLEAVRAAVIPPPRRVNPDVPAQVEAIVLKMLARDPDQRYSWAAEIHEDLLDAMVLSGRLYQNRHLHDWMQASYASAIKAENAKMEAFNELRRPSRAGPTTDPNGTDTDATADFPALPAAVLEALEERRGQDGEHDTQSSAGPSSSGPKTTESPVANRFGTPRVEEVESSHEREPSMVRPAGADSNEDDDPFERTVFDSIPSDDQATVLGADSLPDGITTTQFEVREPLDGRLPSVDADGRVKDAYLDAFTAHDDDDDRTYVHSPEASVDAVFSVEGDTPQGAPLLEVEETYADAGSVLEDPSPVQVDPWPALLKRGPVQEKWATGFEDVHNTVALPPDDEVVPSYASPFSPRLTAAADSSPPTMDRTIVIAVSVGFGALVLALMVFFLQPRAASLKVLSEPVKGAKVFVNGDFVGTTPVRVGELKPGQHRVRLEAKGYQRYTQTIQIQSARPHTMVVPLELVPVPAPPASAKSRPAAGVGPPSTAPNVQDAESVKVERSLE